MTARAHDSEARVTYFLLVVDVGGRFRAQIPDQAAYDGVSSVLNLKRKHTHTHTQNGFREQGTTEQTDTQQKNK